MIFDFYLAYDFRSTGKNWIHNYKFRDEKFYIGIKGEERSEILTRGYITCLCRREFQKYYYQKGEIKLYVFGEVFTNKKYYDLNGKKPYKLDASEILNLYMIDSDNFVHFLKGSFMLVFIDESNNEIVVISDRLNVLPLYYSFSNGKLIVSSNTSLILKANWVDKTPDELSFLMQHLFDYTLGEYYFFRGIRRFENASIYKFDLESVKKKPYWDVCELHHKNLFSRQESLDMLAEQLKENVELYSSDADKILVSLTGGFDGRANLALLSRPVNTFKCYSYGMAGSKQIIVPMMIAQRTGINYEPVILDQEFLDQYYENTFRATYFSNGTAPVGFCNLPYVYSKLSEYSDKVLTGLFGSEILRPLHNTGIMVNEKSFLIFLDKDFKEGINKAIKSIYRNYTNFSSKDCEEALIEYFDKNYFARYNNYKSVTRFFFFIIKEGIRKYFSQEISIERVYVTTRIPYFDTDMVDLIYRTPWAGMYNGFLGESKIKRRNGQLLYAYIFRKYKPELGKIILDRGYKPDDLLLPFPINYLKILPVVIRAKRYMKKAGGNDTFKTEIWAEETLRKIIKQKGLNEDQIFDKNIIYNSDITYNKSNYLTFRHITSIKAFLSLLI